jgi:hypothetical protein
MSSRFVRVGDNETLPREPPLKKEKMKLGNDLILVSKKDPPLSHTKKKEGGNEVPGTVPVL